MVLKHGCIAVIVVLLATSCDLLSSGDNGATDTTPPKVVSVTPENGADEVQVTTTVRAQFNEAIDPETVNPSTFIVKRNAATVAGTRSVDSATVWFEPTDSLQRDTEYTLAVTHVTDKHGNTMQDTTRYSWHTVADDTPSEDTHPPEVVHRTPADNADDVSVATQVKAVFSEPVVYDNGDPLQLVTEDNVTVNASVNLQDTTVTLKPVDSLQYAHTYTAELSSGIADTAGNTLNASSWSFTTKDAPDAEAPEVVSTTPQDDATGVSVDVTPSATFNEPIDPHTADATVSKGGQTVPIDITVNSDKLTINPDSALSYTTEYTVKLPDTIADTAGNTFAGYQWNFTTGENPNAWKLPNRRISYIDADVNGDIYINAHDKPLTVARFNTEGNVAWSHTTRKEAVPNALIVTHERVYMAYTDLPDNNSTDEVVYIETRQMSDGTLLNRIIQSKFESVRSIASGPQNTVYVATAKHGILQLDKSGNEVAKADVVEGVIDAAAFDPTTGHLYIAGGKQRNIGDVLTVDIFLTKLDNQLNKVWTETYGHEMDTTGETIYHQDLPRIAIAPQHNRIYLTATAVGHHGPRSGKYDPFVLGYNTDGSLAWEHVYQDKGNRPKGAAVDEDGNLYIVGEIPLSPAKFAPNGTLLWQATDPVDQSPGFMDVAVHSSTVFVVNDGTDIHRFDAMNGQRK